MTGFSLIAVEGLPEVQRCLHISNCIWGTTCVPVVFCVLPVTVLFAAYPALASLTFTG